MNYPVLQAELQEEAYTNLTDGEAADALNAVEVERPCRFYATFRTLADIMPPARLEALAGYLQQNMPTVHGILSQPGPNDGSAGGVDLMRDSVQAQLAALNSAGLINDDELAALLAFGTETVSRATVLGLAVVTPGDVQRARGGAW